MDFVCHVPKGWQCSFSKLPVDEMGAAWGTMAIVVGSIAAVVAITLAAWFVIKWIDAR